MRRVLATVLLAIGVAGAARAEAEDAEAHPDEPAFKGYARTGAWLARIDRFFNAFGDQRQKLDLIIDDRDIGTGHGLLMDFGFDLWILGSRVQFDYFTDQVVNTAEERIVGGNRLAQQAFKMLVGRIEPRTTIGGATLVLGGRQVDLTGPIARPEQFAAFDERPTAGMRNVQWNTKYTAGDAALMWRTKGGAEVGPMIRYTHFSLPSAMISTGDITATSIDQQRFLVTGTQDMVDFMLAGGLHGSDKGTFFDLSGEAGVGYLRMAWPRWGAASGFSFPLAAIARGGVQIPAGPFTIGPYAGFRFQTWVPLLQNAHAILGQGNDNDPYVSVDPPQVTANWVIVWGPELGLEVHL